MTCEQFLMMPAVRVAILFVAAIMLALWLADALGVLE